MRTKRPDRDHPGAPFLQSVELEEDRVEDWGSYPFHLPFLKGLRVELAPLTFLIGENGSGKTTLIEAMADLCRLPIGGGGRTELADAPAKRAASSLR